MQKAVDVSKKNANEKKWGERLSMNESIPLHSFRYVEL